MLDFKTSKSKCEVSKSNSRKITSFSKTMSLQRELFLPIFYTINLSPLLVIKKGFMIIIILINYQQCPLPLKAKPCITLSLILIVYSLVNLIFVCNFMKNRMAVLFPKLVTLKPVVICNGPELTLWFPLWDMACIVQLSRWFKKWSGVDVSFVLWLMVDIFCLFVCHYLRKSLIGSRQSAVLINIIFMNEN